MRSTVADVMTTEVASVGEDAGYKEIVSTLLERGVSALPVLDGENRVVGVVSEEDLLHKVEFENDTSARAYWPPMRARLRARLSGAGALAERADEKAAGRTAAHLMSTPAVTVAPAALVIEAARLMERRGVKRLPVVDGTGALVGVVSRRDLLRVFSRSDSDIAAAVEDQVAEVSRWDRGEINAVVEDGVVTLSGPVRRRSVAHALAGAVCGVEGVVAVTNNLDWEIDDVAPYPQMGV
ncbi:CBS domain-containing protein [Streptomonospora nanhaiensis]|uniref:CBS domain-containing protein n=1 Tax=Streptomonospora nanhaiensis TaxID=1323731 RepID=A0A853BKP7_9ACTN|nr:CBS domain-containing protein [Streptomonospora nanhaiensis]MBV2364152.1 CBS domain-containing protein [Streptomonospora nanhaiensis]MBX9389453.1 CBS domain-containing protein [Streptomonospora nanhaiensis]NYI95102.1 CBS domain-containing protein [Streptomonospora nanhaiensis]